MSSLPNTNRIDVVDALRGFALAGIVVAHMVEQFIAAPRPAQSFWVELTTIDRIVSTFSLLFVTGKFFSMFAVLFGMSFAIMMGNAAKKGYSFSGRFLWRLVVLSGFGVLHTLLYRGDILTVYVVIGALLPLFYNVPNKWLWTLAVVLFVGLGRLLFFAASGDWTFLGYKLSPESPVVSAYLDTLKQGSLLDVMVVNLAQGFYTKFDFQFAFFGRGYLTLAYFLEPAVGTFHGNFIGNGRGFSGINGRAHENHARGQVFVVVFGHQGDCGKHRRTRLADTDDMRIRPEEVEHPDNVVDIVVQIETTRTERYFPCVHPISYVNFVIR